jgi:hypothetical protein
MAILTGSSPVLFSRWSGYPHGGDRRALLGALMMMAAGWTTEISVTSAAEPLPEYQVKAAFLINFPKYVEWPADAFAETNSPIVIAVKSETEVAREIEKVVAGRTVSGRDIVLKRLAADEETGPCHIRFVSAGEQQRSPNLLATLKGGSILTVGESDSFLERGGIINLARRNEKIALEVNLPAADQARITISSKLLSVARVVKGKAK